MSPEKYHTQIEAWLLGELSPEEAQSFENQMKADDSLSKAVKEQEVAFEAIDLLVEENLTHKLKALQEERYAKPRSIGILRRMPLAIAASVVVLIAAGVAFMMNQNFSNQQLVANNFEISDTGIRGEGNAAFDSFANGDYTNAVAQFETILKENPERKAVQLYLGQSYYMLKDYPKALSQFETVFKNNTPDPRFSNDARWYMGLTYLAMEDKQNAKTIFEELKNNQVPIFGEKAESILNDLESFWRFGK